MSPVPVIWIVVLGYPGSPEVLSIVGRRRTFDLSVVAGPTTPERDTVAADRHPDIERLRGTRAVLCGAIWAPVVNNFGSTIRLVGVDQGKHGGVTCRSKRARLGIERVMSPT